MTALLILENNIGTSLLHSSFRIVNTEPILVICFSKMLNAAPVWRARTEGNA